MTTSSHAKTRCSIMFAVVAGIAISGGWCCALPPESELPRAKKPTVNLPTESQLPARSRSVPGTSGLNEVAQLPPEQALPKPTSTKEPVDVVQVGIVELQDSRDKRARLRLSVPEHTSSVMAIAFDASSNHLFTGGDDKLVHHWRLTVNPESGEKKWLYEDSVRWQVGSGASGRIRALACGGNILYIAGYGADGARGEILRYDWVNRQWLAPWVKHNRPIVRLWASPQGNVVSVDEHFGLWLHRDGAESKLLESPKPQLPEHWPIDVRFTVNGVEWYVGQAAQSTPWAIVRKTEANAASGTWSPAVVQGTEAKVFEFLQRDMTAALNKTFAQDAFNIWKTLYGKSTEIISVSPDGNLLAAVDTEVEGDTKAKGHWLYVWKNGQLIVKTFLVDAAKSNTFDYRSLSWSSDSKKLAVLKVQRGTKPLSRIELWEFDGPTKMRTLDNGFGNEYYSCRFSPDQKWLLLTGQVAVFALPLDQTQIVNNRLPKELGVLPLSEVSFAKGGYKWKGVHAKSNEVGDVVFDPQRMALDVAEGTEWIPHSSPANSWEYKGHRLVRTGNRWVVQRGQTALGAIDTVSSNGMTLDVTVAEWVRQGDNAPTHLAVSYDRISDNEIHLFALDNAKNGALAKVAVLNGHEGSVNSISVSSDSKILLSCGADRQVCTWPLGAIISGERSTTISWQKYGATFAFANAQLTVDDLHPAGPLFEFGLRQGDIISDLAWFKPSPNGTDWQEQKVPVNEAGITYLNQPDFDTVVRFTYTRQGGQPTAVQLKPQWRPLFGQAFDSGREWAAWTAAGFYASSFNGNTLFGWQINRGIEKPPSFYRADRFQAILERPELLRRIIELGSVDAAARAVGETLASRFSPLQNSIALQPIVTIVSPRATSDLPGQQVAVKAEVQVPRGAGLASVKAFANGIPAQLESQTLLPSTDVDHDRFEVSWISNLPNDRDIKIQVLAANNRKLVGASEVIVHRKVEARPASLPRLWLFAGAVGAYQDSLIPSLTTPENNVNAFATQVEMSARGIYDVQRRMVLTGEQMTRNQWAALVSETIDQDIKPVVRPDDIVMVFLSGHGVQDEESGAYYYVPSDANFRDVRAGQYDHCLSISDIAPFTGLACRKIVVLDTCHSGAFQPLESDRLRSAVRALQADMVLTLTASEGDQKAAEDPTKPNSVFTEVVVKLLSQPQDTDGDKLLTLPEFVQQVQSGVFEKAKALQKSSALSQKPKFIPSELLPYVRFPMAQVKQDAR